MTDNNDRKYVREEALAILEELRNNSPCDNILKRIVEEWIVKCRPVLTERTKAVLGEVEWGIKCCGVCKQKESCDAWIHGKHDERSRCHLARIRAAYEKGTKHED